MLILYNKLRKKIPQKRKIFIKIKSKKLKKIQEKNKSNKY